jgi:hypothetical protein
MYPCLLLLLSGQLVGNVPFSAFDSYGATEYNYPCQCIMVSSVRAVLVPTLSFIYIQGDFESRSDQCLMPAKYTAVPVVNFIQKSGFESCYD